MVLNGVAGVLGHGTDYGERTSSSGVGSGNLRFADGRPLTLLRFVEQLREALQAAGVDQSEYVVSG